MKNRKRRRYGLLIKALAVPAAHLIVKDIRNPNGFLRKGLDLVKTKALPSFRRIVGRINYTEKKQLNYIEKKVLL